MKTKVLLLIIFFLIAFSINCEKEERFYCPSCSDEVTWDSYGDLYLQAEGGNGFSIGRNPIHLVSDCGWNLLNNDKTNRINAYSVCSCDTGVILVWYKREFSVIQLQEGWTGSTRAGIKLGDDISKFLELYPYFEYYNIESSSNLPGNTSYFLKYENESNSVFASFYPEGKLTHLYIIKYE